MIYSVRLVSGIQWSDSNIYTCIYICECVYIYIYSFQNFSYYRLLYDAEGFPGGTMVKSPPANAKDASSVPGSGRSPGEGMATHSSILAWEVPWTEEPGRLQSVGL